VTQADIERARTGFSDFVSQRQSEWELMRDDVLREFDGSRIPSTRKTSRQDDFSSVTGCPGNGAIVRSAIASVCLPGDTFNYQRDEISQVMKMEGGIEKNFVILFSPSNQFSGLYVLDDQCRRIYCTSSCPSSVPCSLVDRRFRFTSTRGFIEIGKIFCGDNIFNGVDAITLKSVVGHPRGQSVG
jgi:hypothetical protein